MFQERPPLTRLQPRDRHVRVVTGTDPEQADHYVVTMYVNWDQNLRTGTDELYFRLYHDELFCGTDPDFRDGTISLQPVPPMIRNFFLQALSGFYEAAPWTPVGALVDDLVEAIIQPGVYRIAFNTRYYEMSDIEATVEAIVRTAKQVFRARHVSVNDTEVSQA